MKCSKAKAKWKQANLFPMQEISPSVRGSNGLLLNKAKGLFGFETRRTIDLFENPNGGRFPNAYDCPAC